MNYYYDFSGQKFGYPLSLSINGFDRQVFSRQTSLELSYVLKGEYEAITEHFSCPVKEQELLLIAPGDIHMIRQKGTGENVILTIHVDFSRFAKPMAGDVEDAFESMLCTKEKNAQILGKLKRKIGELVSLLMENDNDLFQMNAIMAELVCIASNHKQYPIERLPLLSENRENYMKAILYISSHYRSSFIWRMWQRRCPSAVPMPPDFSRNTPALPLSSIWHIPASALLWKVYWKEKILLIRLLWTAVLPIPKLIPSHLKSYTGLLPAVTENIFFRI